MTPPLQSTLPYDPFTRPRLPGVQPLEIGNWLIRDEAFAAQMALRDQLLAERRGEVVALDDGAREAADEMLGLVLSLAYPGAKDCVMRPDGVAVPVDRADPLGNVVYRGTSRNFNAVMAASARPPVVEVDEIVKVGDLDPASVATPAIYVDRVAVIG